MVINGEGLLLIHGVFHEGLQGCTYMRNCMSKFSTYTCYSTRPYISVCPCTHVHEPVVHSSVIVWNICFCYFHRYLQEIGYTDTILDIRSNRVRSLLGLAPNERTGPGLETNGQLEPIVNGESPAKQGRHIEQGTTKRYM